MRVATRWGVAAVVLVVSAWLTNPAPAADDPKEKPKVGDPFPDIKLQATQAGLIKKDAKEIGIKDLKGKIVVIAFYPKALTGG